MPVLGSGYLCGARKIFANPTWIPLIYELTPIYIIFSPSMTRLDGFYSLCTKG